MFQQEEDSDGDQTGDFDDNQTSVTQLIAPEPQPPENQMTMLDEDQYQDSKEQLLKHDSQQQMQVTENDKSFERFEGNDFKSQSDVAETTFDRQNNNQSPTLVASISGAVGHEAGMFGGRFRTSVPESTSISVSMPLTERD